MYEVLPSNRPGAPRRIVVRCTGLNDTGDICKRVLFVLEAPKPETSASAARVSIKCRRCKTVNINRVSALVGAQ